MWIEKNDRNGSTGRFFDLEQATAVQEDDMWEIQGVANETVFDCKAVAEFRRREGCVANLMAIPRLKRADCIIESALVDRIAGDDEISRARRIADKRAGKDDCREFPCFFERFEHGLVLHRRNFFDKHGEGARVLEIRIDKPGVIGGGIVSAFGAPSFFGRRHIFAFFDDAKTREFSQLRKKRAGGYARALPQLFCRHGFALIKHEDSYHPRPILVPQQPGQKIFSHG